MKKLLLPFLCLLVLVQASASAEIKKSISDKNIFISSEYRLKIDGTNNFVWLYYYRTNFTKDPRFAEFLDFSVFKSESAQTANSDITFTSKNPPSLALYKNENNIGQAFNLAEIGTTELKFLIINKSLFASAEKAALLISRKDGTTLQVEIPNDVIKEWQFIASCDLKEEYKKGI